MTISTTTQVLYDGPYKAVIQATGLGASGATPNNLTLAVLADNAALVPAPKTFRVDVIEADIGYGVVMLYWAANPSPILFAVMSGARPRFDYTSFGGLQAPDSATGDILISTFMVKLDLQKRLK